MSKVTFPLTIIGLKQQVFSRCYLPASGVRNKRNAQGYNCLMHSESFHCLKVTWLVCCNTPWWYWFSEQKSRAVYREQKDKSIKKPQQHGLSSHYMLMILVLNVFWKDGIVFTALRFWTNSNDFQWLQCHLGLGDICVFPCSVEWCGAALHGSSPRKEAWIRKGQFPFSFTLGTRSPGPLVVRLLSLLYQVNLVMEQEERWHYVPWHNCILIAVGAS